jgi:hypothetical protein
MTLEQYTKIQPYLEHIRIEQCLLPKVCDELATIYESFGWGHINRTCQACISDMMKRFNAFKQEYESRK